MKPKWAQLAQIVALAGVVLATSQYEYQPQIQKSVTLNYNGLAWSSSTTAADVAGLLIENFGDYAGWEIAPAPAAHLTEGMTITITDPSTARPNQTVATNYKIRQLEIAKAAAPPPPKPSEIHSGLATWYRFGDKLTTASRKYPNGTKLRVVAVNSGKSVDVVVNDYGPSIFTGVDLDLNEPAFSAIAPVGAGKIKIKYYKLP